MNGEPLPMLNGFPVRLVVPGYFATYWTKSLTWIRVLETPDENFWMKTAYRIPDTPRGTTTPEQMKAGKVKTIPIERMPVRSFLISPDGSSKIPVGLGVTLRGMAFSGYGKVVKVEVSDDGGSSWKAAELGEDHGAYSFRGWQAAWKKEMCNRTSRSGMRGDICGTKLRNTSWLREKRIKENDDGEKVEHCAHARWIGDSPRG